MGFPLALLSSVSEKITAFAPATPSVAAATEAGWLTVLLKEFFIFPKLRPKNSGENSERKTKRQRSKLLGSPQ